MSWLFVPCRRRSNGCGGRPRGLLALICEAHQSAFLVVKRARTPVRACARIAGLLLDSTSRVLRRLGRSFDLRRLDFGRRLFAGGFAASVDLFFWVHNWKMLPSKLADFAPREESAERPVSEPVRKTTCSRRRTRGRGSRTEPGGVGKRCHVGLPKRFLCRRTNRK
jgi:hypothetical protein